MNKKKNKTRCGQHNFKLKNKNKNHCQFKHKNVINGIATRVHYFKFQTIYHFYLSSFITS